MTKAGNNETPDYSATPLGGESCCGVRGKGVESRGMVEGNPSVLRGGTIGDSDYLGLNNKKKTKNENR